MCRKAFFVTLFLVSLVPIVTGLEGMLTGVSGDFYAVQLDPGAPGNVLLDSNVRYFSGVWLGVGIALLAILFTSIERSRRAFAFLAAAIFLGGVGRVLSWLAFARPHPLFLLFTALELLFPLFLLWWRALQRAPGAAVAPAA